jgi:hypothetical protein
MTWSVPEGFAVILPNSCLTFWDTNAAASSYGALDSLCEHDKHLVVAQHRGISHTPHIDTRNQGCISHVHHSVGRRKNVG